MNILILVWSYVKSRPLNTAINITLLALGIAVITIMLLFNNQLQQKMNDNTRGIDLVIGAKGSPMQLILCNIFHVDFPTGNIPLWEADRISKNGLISKAIPIALGDSYQAFRIVGTNRSYAELYRAEIDAGEWWNENLEVTIGSNVADRAKLKLNDQFASAHGLTEGGHAHDGHHYTVTGIIRPTGTILDDLILTSVESIWSVHDVPVTELAGGDTKEIRSRLVPSVSMSDSTKEITSVLVKYRSPLAAVQLPRLINSQTNLQAASPAFETARIFSILGIGVDIIRGFAYVLITISALSIFIALYNSLKERAYDMAVMRSMGASRTKLLVSVLLEGGLLTFLGCVIGMGMGHGVLMLLPTILKQTEKTGINGLVFYPEEWILLVGSLLLGLVCALIPAVQVYRSNVSKILSGN
jgi:putative ABC transport system permease protein